MIERSLVLLKPDTVKRGFMGRIISRFEDTGLKIIAMKMVKASEELLKEHYPDNMIPIVGNKTKTDWDKWGIKYSESAEEIGEMIIGETRKFIMSGPVVAMVVEGLHAVEVVRKLAGPTGPKDAPPGTIRGDLSHQSLGYASIQRRGAENLVHASGNVQEAKKEISLWFKPEELHEYKTVHENHII